MKKIILNGKVHKFGDFINTDVHCSSKYKPLGISNSELIRQVFADIKPNFSQSVETGDIIVAGEAFGTVSTREDGPRLLKELGIVAVVAKSFGYLFFRNAINMGLPVIECDTSQIQADDRITIDLINGTVCVSPSNIEIKTTSRYSKALLQLIHDGGLIAHLKKNGDYVF